MVLEAFIGPPPFPGALGLHWDDDKLNNYVGNLRWGTYKDNIQDALRNGVHRHSGPACHKGHEWTPENTYTTKKGWRMCRECMRIRDRARYQRKKAAT